MVQRVSLTMSELLYRLREDALGLLSFFSSYGIVPNDLLHMVIQIKDRG